MVTEREFMKRGEEILTKFKKHTIDMNLEQALKFYGATVESIGEMFICTTTKGLSGGLQLSMVLSILQKVIQNLKSR